MEPCTAPAFSPATAKSECGCSHATEMQPARVLLEYRSPLYAPVGISPVLAEESFPSGLVVVLAGAAALAWTRQRLGARLEAGSIVRSGVCEPELTNARLTPHRMPALVPLRAAISRRATGR